LTPYYIHSIFLLSTSCYMDRTTKMIGLRRRYLQLTLLILSLARNECFSVLPLNPVKFLPSSFPLAAEENDNDASASAAASADNTPAEAMQPADLVNGKAFRSAIETLKVEMAKEQGIDYQPQEAAPSQPTLIGRINVELPIPPEIELVETPTMVLVQRLSVSAQEAGINPLDTIVSVSTLDGKYHENVKQMDLESMGPILNEVITAAMKNGDKEIKLELNRLITGYYAEEPLTDAESASNEQDASASSESK